MKFTVKPGERVLQSKDDPTAVLIYDGVPDWVTLPPVLGGGRANVLQTLKTACPCGGGHEVMVLILDVQQGDKNIRVAECQVRGYLWHTV